MKKQIQTQEYLHDCVDTNTFTMTIYVKILKILQYLNGLGYLCQKAETTWSHVLLMSAVLQKYLTILPLLNYTMA